MRERRMKGCCCLADEESIPTRDLSQWRGALNEHERMLKRWQKAWVGPCMHACMQVSVFERVQLDLKHRNLYVQGPQGVKTF